MQRGCSRMSFKNLPEVKRKIRKRLTKDAMKNLDKAIERSSRHVANVARESILSGGRSGRIYMRGGKEHTASARGEAPASDTGTLASSITNRVKRTTTGIVGEVSASADDGSGGNYAVHLEFGTSNMEARPFMVPALNKSARRIKTIFKQEGIIR